MVRVLKVAIILQTKKTLSNTFCDRWYSFHGIYYNLWFTSSTEILFCRFSPFPACSSFRGREGIEDVLFDEDIINNFHFWQRQQRQHLKKNFLNFLLNSLCLHAYNGGFTTELLYNKIRIQKRASRLLVVSGVAKW